MLKDTRNLLWMVPIAVLITMPLWKPLAADFLSPDYRGSGASDPSLKSPRSAGSSEMTGVQIEQSQNGTKDWQLTAGRLYSKDDEPDMQLEDVQALFFGTTGEHEETRIRSQKAWYNTDSKQITLRGDVVIRNNKGYEMLTESLEYLAAEKQIRTTSPVNIQGSNIKVSGNRLLYDTATGNYSLVGHVMCRVW